MNILKCLDSLNIIDIMNITDEDILQYRNYIDNISIIIKNQFISVPFEILKHIDILENAYCEMIKQKKIQDIQNIIKLDEIYSSENLFDNMIYDFEITNTEITNTEITNTVITNFNDLNFELKSNIFDFDSLYNLENNTCDSNNDSNDSNDSNNDCNNDCNYFYSFPVKGHIFENIDFSEIRYKFIDVVDNKIKRKNTNKLIRKKKILINDYNHIRKRLMYAQKKLSKLQKHL